jgi:hypothetical protein
MTNFTKEKMDLFKYYLTHYNENDMIGFCKIALNKYRFENYRMNENNIQQDDMIIVDNNKRDFIKSIISQNSCSKEEFKKVFGMLSIDDIYTIGI